MKQQQTLFLQLLVVLVVVVDLVVLLSNGNFNNWVLRVRKQSFNLGQSLPLLWRLTVIVESEGDPSKLRLEVPVLVVVPNMSLLVVPAVLSTSRKLEL